MKCIILYVVVFSLLAAGLSLSCKKEYSCEGCTSGNKPPVAIAGTDQILTLPVNSTSLDGSTSADPDSNITSYVWTKISGPSSFSIANPSTAKTQLTGLEQGVYLFELHVRDAGGLFSKDTVQIEVNEAPSVDTTFTELVWHFWRQPGVLTDAFDEIYLEPQIPENFFLNIPASHIQVFVRTDSSADWIEARMGREGICNPPYDLQYTVSSMYVHSCPNNYSLIGKKASIRVVIK